MQDIKEEVVLTFLDPPFNQGKEYGCHDDNMPEKEYWDMMTTVCDNIYKVTKDGGSLYFMQREKNCEQVIRSIRESKWTFQNLIIWKKWTSAAAPSNYRHPKHYQIIAFATKGDRAKTFNKLRIDPPLLAHQKYERKNGMFVTDLWDDIKELTAGYFSGTEPILCEDKKTRFHKQQSPLALLVRIILTSSNAGDWVLDPFAGTGTTGCAATQLDRNSISIDNNQKNIDCINTRLNEIREQDKINKYKKCYEHTDNLDKIWGNDNK